MFYIKSIIFFIPLILFLSCSSGEPKPSDEKFAERAIYISYSSSKHLNSYNNQPHVIPLVIYQLSDRTGFDALSKDQAGIIKLLQAKKFDDTVMNVTKHYVSPGENNAILLDRSAKTVWVALVAGYYEMQPEQETIIYQTPSYNGWKFWASEKRQKLLETKIYFDKSSMEQRQKR